MPLLCTQKALGSTKLEDAVCYCLGVACRCRCSTICSMHICTSLGIPTVQQLLPQAQHPHATHKPPMNRNYYSFCQPTLLLPSADCCSTSTAAAGPRMLLPQVLLVSTARHCCGEPLMIADTMSSPPTVCCCCADMFSWRYMAQPCLCDTGSHFLAMHRGTGSCLWFVSCP